MSDTTASAPRNPIDTGAVAGPRPIKRYTTRQVVRGVWRTLVGIKDMLALFLLLLFFILIAATLQGRPNAAGIYTNGALLLKLDGTISEQPAPVDPFAALSGSVPVREFRRQDLVHALEVAATDARVKAVVLDLDRFMGGGQVALGDVGEAMWDPLESTCRHASLSIL